MSKTLIHLDRERQNTVKKHLTQSKQSCHAIFISQLNLYGDMGWGWNFLYRNLASPDHKPVGISLFKSKHWASLKHDVIRSSINETSCINTIFRLKIKC